MANKKTPKLRKKAERNSVCRAELLSLKGKIPFPNFSIQKARKRKKLA